MLLAFKKLNLNELISITLIRDIIVSFSKMNSLFFSTIEIIQNLNILNLLKNNFFRTIRNFFVKLTKMN